MPRRCSSASWPATGTAWPPVGWSATPRAPWYAPSEAARVRQTAENARRNAEEAARVRAWAAKPPEERIAGRLQFWLLGQRAKRREPTAAEIAARRAELLAELEGDGSPATGRLGDAGRRAVEPVRSQAVAVGLHPVPVTGRSRPWSTSGVILG